jgi:uncharacterized protein
VASKATLLYVSLLASALICGSAWSQTNAGKPTFDCARANTSIAQTICKTPSAIQADWSLTTSYWAAYFSAASNDRQRFADSHAVWFKSLERDCFQPANNGQAAQCITQDYQARADVYRKSLSGDALVEASLPPETLIRLQNGLIRMGFLGSDADGEFGTDTRVAIRAFRQSLGHAPAEFLDANERTALLNASPGPDLRRTAPPVDPRAVVGIIGDMLGRQFPMGGLPNGAAMSNRGPATSVQSAQGYPTANQPTSPTRAQGSDTEFSDSGPAVLRAPLAGAARDSAGAVKTVQVTGVGETADAARKDAARLAIQQVVGVFVDNRRRIELNVSDQKVSEVVNEKIISYSNAYVSKLDVVSTDQKDGMFRVTANVGVSVGPLLKVLQDNAVPTVPFDSVTAASTADSLSEEKTGAAQLYSDLIDKADALINVGVGTPSVDPELPSTSEEAWLRIPLTYSVNDDQLKEWRTKFELFAQERAGVALQVGLQRQGSCTLRHYEIALGSGAGWQSPFLLRRPSPPQHGVAACFVMQQNGNGYLAECLGRAFALDEKKDRTCTSERPCLQLAQKTAKAGLVIELLDDANAVIYSVHKVFSNYPAVPIEQSKVAPEQHSGTFANYCVADQSPFFAAAKDIYSTLRAAYGDVVVFPRPGTRIRSYFNVRLQNALIPRIKSIRAHIIKDAS